MSAYKLKDLLLDVRVIHGSGFQLNVEKPAPVTFHENKKLFKGRNGSKTKAVTLRFSCTHCFQLTSCHIEDILIDAGSTHKALVMDNHDLSVLREVDICLNAVTARLYCLRKGKHGVLRILSARSSVREYFHFPLLLLYVSTVCTPDSLAEFHR